MKSTLRRIGWALLALLFVVTGLGVGVYAFWQATHPPKNNTSQQNQNNSNRCQFNIVQSTKVLPAPEIFKPGGTLTQLQSTDLQTGNGAAVKIGDCLTVKYFGTLAKDGTVFDENFDKPTALKFQLGVGEVIPGWDQSLEGMKVGGTRRIVIPSNLAYGSQATGAIPANSTLVFVIYLVSLD